MVQYSYMSNGIDRPRKNEENAELYEAEIDAKYEGAEASFR